MVKRFLPLGILVALLMPMHVAFAEEVVEKKSCSEMFKTEQYARVVHGIQEASHDPMFFLLRRCIMRERQAKISERRRKRQVLREDKRSETSTARGIILRERTERYSSRAVLQQMRKRLADGSVDASRDRFKLLLDARRSRREIIKKHRGRNALMLQRRLDQYKSLNDPCKSAFAIQNAKCVQTDAE